MEQHSSRVRWAGRAHIGSFTAAGGEGITTATVDADTGRLRMTAVTDAGPDPSFLAPTPDGTTLTCVNETEQGTVSTLRTHADGRLELLGRQPVHGAHPTHLSLTADASAVLTANYGSGSVSLLPLRADGAPGPVADVLDHRGSGPVPDRQEGPHAHQVLPDPSGRWVLAVDLGTDGVYVYAPPGPRLALRPHGNLRLPAGRGPRHLAFHPSGQVVYVVNELAPTVAVCAWDATAGRLTLLHELRLVPGDATGPHYPSNAVVAPDGRHLHVAERGGNTLTSFALSPSGTALEPVSVVDCGGDWPRHLAADPSGRRLYVANERSGTVAWFDVDQETGVPAQAGALPVAAPSCVVFG